MAGPFWGSIGQGFFAGQDAALQRQMQQIKLQEMQRQQALQGQTGKAMGYGLDALTQLQPPPPGQQSQPPQQAPQQQAPQQPPPQMGAIPAPPIAPTQRPPQPPPLGAPGGQAPMKPYSAPQPPMGGQPQPQQQGLPQPPMQNPMMQQQQPSLRDVAVKLRKEHPEMDPEALMTVLGRMEPLFNMEDRARLHAATLELNQRKLEEATRNNQAKIDELRKQHEALAKYRGTDTAPGEAPTKGTMMGLHGAQSDAAEALAKKRTTKGTGGMKVGKPQMFQGDDGKMYSRMLTSEGQIITRDASGRHTADDVQGAGSAGQQTMRNTVKLDISEIDYALDEIPKLNSKTASPFFMDNKDKGALTRWRDNKLTPDEMQQYDVYANRIASAIAGMQSMGRGQISDEKIRQAQKLVPQPGDGEPTIKAKLAAIKRIRDNTDKILQSKSVDEIRGNAGPTKISSDDEFNALPSGAEFIAPDGSHRRKP